MSIPSCYNDQGSYMFNWKDFEPTKELSLAQSGVDDATTGYPAALPAGLIHPSTGAMKGFTTPVAKMKMSNIVGSLLTWTYSDNFTTPAASARSDALHTTLAKITASPASGEIAITAWKTGLYGAMKIFGSSTAECKIFQNAFTDLITRDFTASPATADTNTRLFETLEQWAMRYPEKAYAAYSTVLKGLGGAFTLPADALKYNQSQQLLEISLRHIAKANPGVEPTIAYDATDPATAVSNQFNKLLGISVVKLCYDGTYAENVTKPEVRFKGVAVPEDAYGWNSYFTSAAYTKANYYASATQKHTERLTLARSKGALTDSNVLDILTTLKSQFSRKPCDESISWLDAARFPTKNLTATDDALEFARRELAQIRFTDICKMLKGLTQEQCAGRCINFHDQLGTLVTAAASAKTAYDTAATAVNTAQATYDTTPNNNNKATLNSAISAAQPLAKTHLNAAKQVRDNVWQQLIATGQLGEVRPQEDSFPIDYFTYFFTAAGFTPSGNDLADAPHAALADNAAVVAKFVNAVDGSKNDLQTVINTVSTVLPKQLTAAIDRLPSSGIDSTAKTALVTLKDTLVKGPDVTTTAPLEIIQTLMNSSGLPEKAAYTTTIEATTFNLLNPTVITTDQKGKAKALLESVFASVVSNKADTLSLQDAYDLYFGTKAAQADPTQAIRALAKRFTAEDLVTVNIPKEFADLSTATAPNLILQVVIDKIQAVGTTDGQILSLLESIPDAVWPVWKQIISTANNAAKLPEVSANTSNIVERMATIIAKSDAEITASLPGSTKAEPRAKEIVASALKLFSVNVASSFFHTERKMSNAQLAVIDTGSTTKLQTCQQYLDTAVSAYALSGVTAAAFKTWFTNMTPATAPPAWFGTTNAEGFVQAKKDLATALFKVLTLNSTLSGAGSADRTALFTAITNAGVSAGDATTLTTSLGVAANVQEQYRLNTFVPQFDKS